MIAAAFDKHRFAQAGEGMRRWIRPARLAQGCVENGIAVVGGL